jgi:hypothetical protein
MKKLTVVMVGLAVVLALRMSHHDNKLVFDRFWVDHLPRNADDQFQSLFLNGEIPVGHFGTQTPWRGEWEAFHYHIVARGDGELDLLFRNDRQRVQMRARECSEQGFDYCLEVTGSSRGVQRYYSQRAWDKRHPEEIQLLK